MENNFQGGVPVGTQGPGAMGGSGVDISHVGAVDSSAPAGSSSADMKKVEGDAAIGQFVEGLIMKKGLNDVDELQKLKNELSEELVEQINQSLLYALTDEEFAKLEAKGENFTEEDFQAAIRNSGIDVEKVTKETVEKFENVFMGIKLEEVA
ncbi:MAG: hypothetical protein Q4F60_02680 [Candidatus Saccharibacteria bacterium]|nr:hypothetical protein [Candidatus Saccharibacteria bacterium]